MFPSDRAELTRALLSYMFENAAASDTLDGIVEWWLLDRRVADSMTEVKSVLDDLVSRNLVVQRTAPDKRVHYSVNRHKEKQIRELLRARSAE